MAGAASSIDGRTFGFHGVAPLDARLGGFVLLTPADGSARIGQVLSEAAEAGGTVAGSGRILGVVSDGNVVTDDAAPFVDAALAAAPEADVAAYMAAPRSHATLAPGSLTLYPSVPARLPAEGFARHTFMCGQSGSGKTYTLGLILERLLMETDLRIAILDPNSDFVHLPELVADGGPGGELADEWRSRIAPSIHVLSGDRLKFRFGRLPLSAQAMVLALHPLGDAEEMDLLRTLVEEIGGREYTLADVRDRAASRSDPVAHRLRLRIDNTGVANLGMWATRDEPPMLDRLPADWRAAVFDLGSLETALERSIVASSLARNVWESRRERRPILVVIDEAHHVCPQTPDGEQQKLALDHVAAIAGEGRKFGIYLLLVTQRPQKIHESVLSQCENLVLMKMTSAVDIAALTQIFSFVPADLIRTSASFRLGEGLAAGRIAPAPLLFRSGDRWTREGGSDVPTTWAMPVRRGR